MSDLDPKPSIEQVEQEASEWIARLNGDVVSDNDRAEFKTWLAQDPIHERMYEELLVTWRLFEQLQFEPESTVDTAVHMPVRQTMWQTIGQWLYGWRRLAVVTVGVAAALFFGVYLQLMTVSETYQTTFGEHVSVSLPDGSTVQLNSDSRVRVDYSFRTRVIHLEKGEAYFEVAHDTDRPFWVTAGSGWVRAVGTAFGVYLNPKGVRVTVHEGTVKLGAADKALTESISDKVLDNTSAVLTVGEQASLEGGVAVRRSLSNRDLERVDAWRDGWLYIENENLCDVVTELDRHTPRQLVLEDNQLCSLSVGGSFQANPQGAEALLSMLEVNYGAQISRDGNLTRIKAAHTSTH